MDHGNNGKWPGLLAAPQRNNYFYGKLMDVPHFQMEQSYGKRKRWTLNRLSLGAGVLCGLDVIPNDGMVCVSPGVAIDALGREIIVPEAVCIDPWQLTDDCGRPADKLSDNEEPTVYICLAYHECVTDYMPVLVTDCNMREQCSPGTIVESFCLLVRKGQPEKPTNTPTDEVCDALANGADEAEKRRLLCEALKHDPCPAPAKKPCVVLASVTLLKGHKVGEIQICSRTMILSNARLLDLILCLAKRGGAGIPGPKGDTGSQGPPGVSVKTADAETIPAGEPAEADFDPATGNIRFKIPKGDPGPPGPGGSGSGQDLIKIIGTKWMHAGTLTLDEFMNGLWVTFNSDIDTAVKPEKNRGWFLVTIEYPIMATPDVPHIQQNTIFTQRVLDSGIEIRTNRALFTPHPDFRNTFDRVKDEGNVGGEILCRVIVKCNYLTDNQNRLVDGDFFGKFPSGAGVPGGDFESWFVFPR